MKNPIWQQRSRASAVVMSAATAGSDYYDYETEPNVFANIEKDEDGKFPLKVSKKVEMNHDSIYLTLEYPNKDWTAGVWAGGHYIFHQEINGKM